ncbi:MAG: hypothetical protein WC227_01850 [Patescibacteria group bacterium]
MPIWRSGEKGMFEDDKKQPLAESNKPDNSKRFLAPEELQEMAEERRLNAQIRAKSEADDEENIEEWREVIDNTTINKPNNTPPSPDASNRFLSREELQKLAAERRQNSTNLNTDSPGNTPAEKVATSTPTKEKVNRGPEPEMDTIKTLAELPYDGTREYKKILSETAKYAEWIAKDPASKDNNITDFNRALELIASQDRRFGVNIDITQVAKEKDLLENIYVPLMKIWKDNGARFDDKTRSLSYLAAGALAFAMDGLQTIHNQKDKDGKYTDPDYQLFRAASNYEELNQDFKNIILTNKDNPSFANIINNLKMKKRAKSWLL